MKSYNMWLHATLTGAREHEINGHTLSSCFTRSCTGKVDWFGDGGRGAGWVEIGALAKLWEQTVLRGGSGESGRQ